MHARRLRQLLSRISLIHISWIYVTRCGHTYGYFGLDESRINTSRSYYCYVLNGMMYWPPGLYLYQCYTVGPLKMLIYIYNLKLLHKWINRMTWVSCSGPVPTVVAASRDDGDNRGRGHVVPQGQRRGRVLRRMREHVRRMRKQVSAG